MANNQRPTNSHGAIEDTEVPFSLKLLVVVMSLLLIGVIAVVVMTMYYGGFLAFT